MQKMVDEVRGKGAQVVVVLSHNGMDVDLKIGVARARHRCHPSAAIHTMACRSPRW